MSVIIIAEYDTPTPQDFERGARESSPRIVGIEVSQAEARARVAGLGTRDEGRAVYHLIEAQSVYPEVTTVDL